MTSWAVRLLDCEDFFSFSSVTAWAFRMIVTTVRATCICKTTIANRLLQNDSCKTQLQSDSCKLTSAKRQLKNNNCKIATRNTNSKGSNGKTIIAKHQLQSTTAKQPLENSKCSSKRLKNLADPALGSDKRRH